MPTFAPVSWMVGLTLPAQTDGAPAKRHAAAIPHRHCFTLKVNMASSSFGRAKSIERITARSSSRFGLRRLSHTKMTHVSSTGGAKTITARQVLGNSGNLVGSQRHYR